MAVAESAKKDPNKTPIDMKCQIGQQIKISKGKERVEFFSKFQFFN
jgi:hypothetical protein